ncbi:Xanthine/uracil permease, partial [Mycena crocata]
MSPSSSMKNEQAEARPKLPLAARHRTWTNITPQDESHTRHDTTRHAWLGDYESTTMHGESPLSQRSAGKPVIMMGGTTGSACRRCRSGAINSRRSRRFTPWMSTYRWRWQLQPGSACASHDRGDHHAPIIFASALGLDSATSAYMISASLIGCGILSLVQMSRIKLFRGLLPWHWTDQGLWGRASRRATAIFGAMYNDGTCITTADGTITRGACPDAYGKVLETSLICSLLDIDMSFVPSRALQRILPPMVTGGTVILMIGASLIGVWGSLEFIGLGFLSLVSILNNNIVVGRRCRIYGSEDIWIGAARHHGLGGGSRQAVEGLEFDSRIQAGVLARGLRLFCCVFLILFGILGKIASALFASPNLVLGGVKTFLFASVAVSGLRVLVLVRFGHRERFVFAGVGNPKKALKGLFDSIIIVLSTPLSLSARIVASVLNLILSFEAPEGLRG